MAAEPVRRRRGRRPGSGGLAARYLGRWADRTLTYQARLAESLYRRAIQAAEASTGEEPELVIGLALGRAECLIELGRHEEAAHPANAARDLAKGAGDEHLEARALLAPGRIESDVGDLEVARRLLTQALSSFEAVGDLGGQGWAKHRLSEVWDLADYAAELRHLREAYRLFDRAGDRWGSRRRPGPGIPPDHCRRRGVPRLVPAGPPPGRGQGRSQIAGGPAADLGILQLLPG